MMST
jgi:hypothetical protein